MSRRNGFDRRNGSGENLQRKEFDDVIMVGTNKEAVLKIEHRYDGNTKDKTKTTCHFCHKPGHFKADCFKFKAQHEKEQEAAKIATQTRRTIVTTKQ
jgi:hypothetical protein